MKQITTAAMLGIGMTLTAQAHHSLGMFEDSKTLTLEGTVTHYEWVNPHAEIFVDIADTSGTESEWKIEGGSLGMMIRGGWRADTLMLGDKVTLVVHPPRNDAKNLAQLVTVTVADGRTLSATPR